MKSRRRALIRSAWTAVFLAGLVFVYLQAGLLPGRGLREKILASLRESTGRNITFTKAVFVPGAGLSLDDFRIAGSEGSSIFSAKTLRVDIKLLPFLLEKKIVIRNLILDSPLFEYAAGRAPAAPEPPKTQISGQIDVPVAPARRPITLDTLKSEGADAFLPENVYLEQIEIRRGLARFYGADGTLSEIVEIADLKMAYRKPPVVDFNGEIRIGSPAYSTLHLRGGWDLERARYDFFLHFKSDRVPAWLASWQDKHVLILRRGRIDLAAKLSSVTETRAAFHAKARLSDAEIRAAHAAIRGRSALEAKGVFDFDRRTFERYKGTLKLASADLENVSEQFRRIEGVDGVIGFEPDLVTIESIRGRWNRLAFEAKGTIRSFKQLLLDGEIRSRLSIDDALALIPPEQKKLLAGFRLGGVCDALTTLRGTLKKGGTIVHEHRLVVENGFLENPERRLKLDDLRAELFMDDRGLRIRNTRFRAGATAYRLDASVPRKPASRGAVSLSTSAWRLQADYDVAGNDLRVRSGRAEGYGASMSFAGTVRDIQKPSLELKGQARADLAELTRTLPPPSAKALQGADLRGTVSGPFTLSGPWNQPRRWNLRIDAKSDRVLVRDAYRLDRFEIQLRAQNGIVQAPYAHATAYGGGVSASLTADLNRSPAAFALKLHGSDLDLALIGRDLLPPRSDLEGKLLFGLELRGLAPDASTWTGGGSIGISQGKFGRTDRFKDMGKLPFVRVEGMDDVTFHQLRATFHVGDRRLRTTDLAIYGDNVNLFLDGAVGFDARLDLAMRIHYSEGVLEGAFQTGGIVPFVVSEADSMISDYRVRGTLSSPVFEKSFLPVDPVKAVGKKVGDLAQAVAR